MLLGDCSFHLQSEHIRSSFLFSSASFTSSLYRFYTALHTVDPKDATLCSPHITTHPHLIPSPFRSFCSVRWSSFPPLLILRLSLSRSIMLCTLAKGPSSTSTKAFLRSSSSRPGVLKMLCLLAAEMAESLDWPDTDMRLRCCEEGMGFRETAGGGG